MGQYVTIGITSYRIEQDHKEGRLALDLYVHDPEQKIETYATFLNKFQDFLNKEGYGEYLLKP